LPDFFIFKPLKKFFVFSEPLRWGISWSMIKQPTTFCRRCGTCCKKGGPTLHLEDQPAVEQGLIPLKSLLTLRKGELAYDPVVEALRPVGGEIIKIKGSGPTWTCFYYDPGKEACRIYDDRPFECRLLKCWDTADFEAAYQKNRLTRKDLISEVKGLWDVVSEHERRCRYADIHRRIGEADSGWRELADIIDYDTELRRRVVAQGRLEPQILDFLFGRPLEITLRAMYGLRFRRDAGKINLSSIKVTGMKPQRGGAKRAE
jgi:Fe-S-cluster containining protein